MNAVKHPLGNFNRQKGFSDARQTALSYRLIDSLDGALGLHSEAKCASRLCICFLTFTDGDKSE